MSDFYNFKVAFSFVFLPVWSYRIYFPKMLICRNSFVIWRGTSHLSLWFVVYWNSLHFIPNINIHSRHRSQTGIVGLFVITITVNLATLFYILVNYLLSPTNTGALLVYYWRSIPQTFRVWVIVQKDVSRNAGQNEPETLETLVQEVATPQTLSVRIHG